MPFLEESQATDQDLVRSAKYKTAVLAADEGKILHHFPGQH
jgi:hypothetical protein